MPPAALGATAADELLEPIYAANAAANQLKGLLLLLLVLLVSGPAGGLHAAGAAGGPSTTGFGSKVTRIVRATAGSFVQMKRLAIGLGCWPEMRK